MGFMFVIDFHTGKALAWKHRWTLLIRGRTMGIKAARKWRQWNKGLHGNKVLKSESSIRQAKINVRGVD